MASDHLARWEVGEILHAQPGLSLKPKVDGSLRLSGPYAFRVKPNDLELIEDSYELEISVPDGYPEKLPVIKELSNRIPKDFHTNPDESLCLGSELRIRLILSKSPSLLHFAEQCITPYLYGFSYKEKNGSLPFGELEHGKKGLLTDYAELFGVRDDKAALKMVWLTSLHKRVANKNTCPCRSGHRLGKCSHHLQVNNLRKILGRGFFKKQFKLLS